MMKEKTRYKDIIIINLQTTEGEGQWKVALAWITLQYQKMEAMKNDIAELMTNQNHMLEAIKYLNERIEYKAKNVNTNEVNDLRARQ